MDTLSEVYSHAQKNDKDIQVVIDVGPTSHGKILTHLSDHEAALFARDVEGPIMIDVCATEEEWIQIEFV